MPDDAAFTIAELARLAGLNVRTIRYYLAQGLIPASGESGPGAHYGQGHLDRLRLTKRLQGEHLPLAEIRARLTQLSDAEVASLLESASAAAGPQTSALDYVRSVLGGADARSLAAGRPPAPLAALAPRVRVGPAGAGDRRARLLRAFSAAPRAAPSPTPPVQGARDAAAPYATDDVVASAPPSMPAMRDTTDAPNPERSQWERLSLGPNLELHIRRPLSRIEQRRVERLITIARQVLRDDRA